MIMINEVRPRGTSPLPTQCKTNKQNKTKQNNNTVDQKLHYTLFLFVFTNQGELG